MLDAAESAARRRAPHRGDRWKTVLPDDILIAHERRRGRCRPASSAAAAAADEAADEAADAPNKDLHAADV